MFDIQLKITKHAKKQHKCPWWVERSGEMTPELTPMIELADKTTKPPTTYTSVGSNSYVFWASVCEGMWDSVVFMAH